LLGAKIRYFEEKIRYLEDCTLRMVKIISIYIYSLWMFFKAKVAVTHFIIRHKFNFLQIVPGMFDPEEFLIRPRLAIHNGTHVCIGV
jgi:hypothetical protein